MRATLLFICVPLAGCVSSLGTGGVGTGTDAAVVRTDISPETSGVADASVDSLDAHIIAPGCGESFLEIDYTLPSGERRQVCRSTTEGLGATYQVCLRFYVASEFLGELSPRVATWRVSERGGFGAVGPSTMQFVAASPLGSENCPPTDEFCSKLGDCRVSVTVAGRVGDRVEAVLTAPCELRQADDPGRVVIVHSARIAGRMTLANGGVFPHDGGPYSGMSCDY